MGASRELAWVKVADTCAWTPRDSCGEVVYKGRMWLMGGWPGSVLDVWSSANGTAWTRATPKAAWLHCDLPTSLVFRDRMWMIAGWQGGRKPTASASNQAWWSTDGAEWHQATAKAPWCPRLGAAGVVFKDRMWILGGVERYHQGDNTLLNDVWSSADGVHWEQATAHAAWAPRSCHAAVVFDGKIWVYGGGNYRPTYTGYNDVWNSADGVHWTRVTAHAAWSHRIWFSGVVYRGRMWVLGGWSDRPSTNWNDVWHSADGMTWTELKAGNIWSKRHEHSAYVFDDKIWVMAGNPWPVVNDVWSLHIPEGWLDGR